MLSIPGHSRSPLCDGITRRDTLRLGALTLGGLTLPELLRAEQVAGIRKSHKSRDHDLYVRSARTSRYVRPEDGRPCGDSW